MGASIQSIRDRLPRRMSISKRAIYTALVVSTATVFLLHNDSVAKSRNEDLQLATLTTSDRLSCRWLGICGISHIEQGNIPKLDDVVRKEALHNLLTNPLQEQAILPSWERQPASAQEKKPVPQFVLDHAPLVHLFSEEIYWPSDIAEHLRHTSPTVEYDFVEGELAHPTTANLAELNSADGDIGWNTYLQSNDNILDMPEWLTSEYGIPFMDEQHIDDASVEAGKYKNNFTSGGRSSAPAVLMVVDKGNGVVDAMWHFFYSYNLGNGVFGIRFGNHVGDWEHTVVRFHNGTPVEMFLSEHAGGASYTFRAMEKDASGQRVSLL